MSPLKAGTAQIDISPLHGVQLQGYPYQSRENTGIHDLLYANCLYLDDGSTSVLLLTTDLVGFEKPYAAHIRREIARRTGTPESHIMLSGSHTHSGPRMMSWLLDTEQAQGWRVESGYLDTLTDQLADLAVRAQDRSVPAAIGFAQGRAGPEQGIGGNRHHPNGLSDPGVGVMGVQDVDGNWLAVWVKYSLHPTILQVENTLVSADFPGAIRTYLAEAKPDAMMMFAQGATGDQSSRYFRRDQSFAEVERFGRTIGKEVDRILESIIFEENPVLGAANTFVEVRWKEIPPVSDLERRIEQYWQELRRLEADKAPYVQRQTCYLDRLGTEYTLAYARLREEGRENPWDQELPLEIQVVRIGEAGIVALPGEIFVEYTLAVEQGAALQPAFVVTLANGLTPGYVVSDEAAAKKVFESGVSMILPETGADIVHAALDLCQTVK